MSRTLLSALLLLIVGFALSRDAGWPPLLNEASAENVIQAYLGRQERAISCGCDAPTSACEQVCRSLSDLEWECGTPALTAECATVFGQLEVLSGKSRLSGFIHQR